MVSPSLFWLCLIVLLRGQGVLTRWLDAILREVEEDSFAERVVDTSHNGLQSRLSLNLVTRIAVTSVRMANR